jgi:hypothetical protein
MFTQPVYEVRNHIISFVVGKRLATAHAGSRVPHLVSYTADRRPAARLCDTQCPAVLITVCLGWLVTTCVTISLQGGWAFLDLEKSDGE